MMDFFKHSISNWVKYDKYEYKKDSNGTLYIKPADNATPTIYNPLKNTQQIVIDALNIGAKCMSREKDAVIQKDILKFVNDYGLLGIMTAMPTTTKFIDYEYVYFAKKFLNKESMSSLEYADLFFPFEKPEIQKGADNSVRWDIATDTAMMALALTMGDRPTAVNMEFQRIYAEKYDWIKATFKDLAFTFITTQMIYDEDVKLEEQQKDLYKAALNSLENFAPTYRIMPTDNKPTLVWEFSSLLSIIQIMMCFMLTDEKSSIKLCRKCHKVFLANRSNASFCSGRCKNQYNVYKSRAKKKKD